MPDIEARLSARPLYLQVRDVLVQRILDGQWKPGSSLPNEGSLAQQLGISIGTVRKALDLLESERIVMRRQGRGTFVKDYSQHPLQFSSLIDRRGSSFLDSKRVKTVATIAATDEDAARLQIRAGDSLLRVERVRYHDERPYLTEVCKLPAQLFKVLPETFGEHRLSSLAQQNAMLVSRADESVAATLASEADAADLNVEIGTPLLALDRVIYSEQSQALEWRVAKCFLRAERFVVQYQ